MSGLLCVCPPERRTARPQPAAHRTRRPTARRTGPAPPRPRDFAAASRLHPPAPSAASSPSSQGFPGQLTQHQYVVGTFSLTQIGQTSCFSRSSPISDGSRAQPKQARLGASDASGGAPLTSVVGGAAAAASVASRSAFRAVSASRTSLLPAPRSGCCSRSLASSGLGPSSGSARHSRRTASRRPSAMRGRQRDPHTARFGEAFIVLLALDDPR
eukprot:scaffold13023_cov70-Phaeocystis_antarctica.AAC.2